MDRRDFLRASVAAAAATTTTGAFAPHVALAGKPVREESPSAPAASSVFVDVRDHGATGNGTTDDTAAIQAAIDTAAWTDALKTTWRGGQVYFAPGTYRISRTLVLPSYTGLLGEPGWKSRIVLAPGANCDMLATRLDGTYNEYQSVQHLCFDGNRAGQTATAHGLRFHASTRPYLSHCLVRGVKGYGIHMTGAADYTMQPMLSHCVVVENGNGIGLFAGCSDALVYNCDVGANTYGMAIQGGAHVIVGGTLWGNWVGAQTTTAHVTFNGVRVDQNQAHGLEFATPSCSNCQVTGCSIYWNSQSSPGAYSGVHVHNSARDLFVGASMIGSTYAEGGSETQAFGVFADATTHDIHVGVNMFRANLTEDVRLLGSGREVDQTSLVPSSFRSSVLASDVACGPGWTLVSGGGLEPLALGRLRAGDVVQLSAGQQGAERVAIVISDGPASGGAPPFANQVGMFSAEGGSVARTWKAESDCEDVRVYLAVEGAAAFVLGAGSESDRRTWLDALATSGSL